MDRILKLESAPLAHLSGAAAGPVRQNGGHLSSRAADENRAGAASEADSLLVKYGIRFSDPHVEREFLLHYRQQFYFLGQSAIGIAVAAWLVFGSIGLTATQGSYLVSIKFFYLAAPVLFFLLSAGFLSLAKERWQTYYALTTLVFTALIYVSGHMLQEQPWFRAEYITMTYMMGIALVGMAPVLIINALILQAIMVGVALYYILNDVQMAEFPTLYAIFSSVFLATTLLIGFCFSVTRERSLRREFAVMQALGRSKRD
jgi:hypothetical protein